MEGKLILVSENELFLLLILGVVVFVSLRIILVPRVTGFKPVYVRLDQNLITIVILEVIIESCLPLKCLKLEKNLCRDFYISIEYCVPKKKRILMIDSESYHQRCLSYRVKVENMLWSCVSGEIHVDLCTEINNPADDIDDIESFSIPLWLGSALVFESPRHTDENDFLMQDKNNITDVPHKLYSNTRKRNQPRKQLQPIKHVHSENEYIDSDPEKCSRCLANVYGSHKCGRCFTPYCSSKCKYRDSRKHKKECPEMRKDDEQRVVKEKEYAIRIKTLEEDNDRLKEHALCKICLEENANVAFDPCGHLCCCHDCSSNLQICPMCREKVDKTLKVFI